MSNYLSAVDPPKDRRTVRLTSSVLTSALLITALAPLAAAPTQAATAGTGPVSTMHGYPEWYDDGTVKLALCYEAGKGCLSEVPNPLLPPSYPDNFPDESFWFAAAADLGTIGSYEAALEAAHATEAVVNGDQIGFGRLRFRFEGLLPEHDYTVAHPYGTNVLTSDIEGIINETLDKGCAGNPCDWNAVGQAFLGDYAVGSTATFLRQTTSAAGTIGDINTPRTVTGAPSGFNAVSVKDEAGTVIASTTLFTVQGVIANVEDGAPSTPNLVDASDTGPSKTDGITSATTPTFDGTATDGAQVELVVDGVVAGTTTATGGAYSFALTTALLDGTHTVQARVTDPADTVDGFATSGTLTITVDTVAPSTTINPPFPSSPSADNTPTFHFSSNETTATFECQLVPTNATYTPCTDPKTWDAQVNGTHTFNVRATDRAGNIGTAATRTITIGSGGGVTSEQKDMNGDGNPDLVARDSGGRLWLYPSTSASGFGTRVQIGSGWGGMNAILQPGDFNGDARTDIMARDTSGRLWLYTGTGTGRINSGVQIGSGWSGMTALVTPGDFSGDGKVDLLARSSTGALFLYPGNGTGGFGTRTQPGSGWQGMTAMLSTGDFSGDGNSDVIARNSSGALFLFRGNGTGGFGTSNQIGSSWNGYALTGPGAWGTADAHNDLIARDSSGRLWVYRGSGTGGFTGTRTQIGTGWGGFTIVQ
jgi:hypothetical protein